MVVKKTRGRTRKRRVIDQRSVQINQKTKPRSFLLKDHVIDLQVGRKEKGHVRGHQIVNMTNHILVNGQEVKVQGRIEIGQEAKALKGTRTDHEAGLEVQDEIKTGHGAEVQEKAEADHAVGVRQEETGTDHGAEVQEETRTDHAVGALKGKELEAEVQEKLGIDRTVPVKEAMTSKDHLHQKESNAHTIVFSIELYDFQGMLCPAKMKKKWMMMLHHYQSDNLYH